MMISNLRKSVLTMMILSLPIVGASFSTPAAVAGYPHLTVPAGLASGLPIGLSFVGAAWSEERLLAYGHAYEQATRLRSEPTYRKVTTPQES